MLNKIFYLIGSSMLPHCIKTILVLIFEIIFIFYRKILKNKKANNLQKPPPKLTIILTGGSSGIGEELLKLLLNLNYKVIVLSRNKPQYDCIFIQTDFNNLNSVSNTANKLRNKKIDILICNTGVFNFTDKNELDENFVVNYLGHFLLVKVLIKNVNKIVFTGSSVIFTTNEFLPVKTCFINSTKKYAISKLACLLLIKHLKVKFNKRCVAVHPGVVPSNLFKSRFARFFLQKFYFLFESKKEAAENIFNAIFDKRVTKKSGICDMLIRNEVAVLPKYVNYKNSLFLWEYSLGLLKEKS